MMGHSYATILLIILAIIIGFYNLFHMYDQPKKSRQQRQYYSNTSISILKERLEVANRDEEEEVNELEAMNRSIYYAKLEN